MKFKNILLSTLIGIGAIVGCSNESGNDNPTINKPFFLGDNTVAPLHLNGALLVNDKNEPVQLTGMSSHGLQWYGDFMNYDSIKWLKEDWNMNLLRAAMYTKEGGYMDNQNVIQYVKQAIENSIRVGIYVIVDWHNLTDGNPQIYKNYAKAFFDYISKQYGVYNNLIYEVCNEPNGSGVTWNNGVKAYNEELINLIRKNDPDNIIIACTPNWGTDIASVTANPIRGQKNVMQNVHFYSGGTDGNWLRGKIDEALSKGIPVFITEWGTSYYTGNDGLYFDSAKIWLKYMKDRNISWANWSLADKNETSAALKPGANRNGNWPMGQISESGKFIRSYLREN